MTDLHNSQRNQAHIEDDAFKAKAQSITYNSPCDIPLGQKFDDGKTHYNLVPPLAHEAHADVLTFGAKKYAPDNWRYVEDARNRYINAAFRHLHAHRKGELLDPESGLPHLAHAIASISFTLELELEEAIDNHVKLMLAAQDEAAGD